MPRLARALATVGGIGYLPKAPGTAGSLVGWLIGLLVCSSGFPQGCVLTLWLCAFLIGVAASTSTERTLKVHDPSCVVIDEMVGMWAVLMAVPRAQHLSWLSVIAFGVFRLFDVTKPPPLKHLARLPAGWGIMLDDLGASAYTCLVLTWLTRVLG